MKKKPVSTVRWNMLSVRRAVLQKKLQREVEDVMQTLAALFELQQDERACTYGRRSTRKARR